MEHWFDALSRPTTRRTALKGAAVAVLGIGLGLPALRPSTAQAAESEPCFAPCIQASTREWDTAYAGCLQLKRAGTVNFAAAVLGAAPLVILSFLQNVAAVSCGSSAELDWHRASLACRGSECGNGAKYPGGTVPVPPKPKPKCDPIDEIACGDTCCYTFNKCCPDASAPGGYACWAADHTC